MSRSSIIKSLEDEENRFESVSAVRDHITTASNIGEHVNILLNDQNNPLSAIPSRITENFVVIWLNLNTNELDENTNDSIIKLQHLINSIKTFNDLDESIDFISDIKYEQIFMIICGSGIQNFVYLIEDISKLRTIYVFDSQSTDDKQWLREHKKVKGIYTRIDDICDVLKKDMYGLVIDLTPFSIISPISTDLNELDQSFMYTQILKEIILKSGHNEKSRKEFIDFCLNKYENNAFQCDTIRKFDRDYQAQLSLWWYSKEWFLYSTINTALRTQDVDVIIKMGFFLHDLHQEIERKYTETRPSSKQIVYRGQGMANVDFDKLKKNKGGLLSFNSFLSTSIDRGVSMMFADSNRTNLDTTGVLFKIEIDPSISTTPYTSLDDASEFLDEQEILFSMHTIFRIDEMTEIEDHLWEVNLILTNNNDEQLKRLTDCIKLEIGGVDGWFSMGILLHKMGKLDKALDVYTTLLEKKFDGNPDLQPLLRQLTETNISEVHRSMGNYSDALKYLEPKEQTCQDTHSSHHLVLLKSYDGIAGVHLSRGNYSTALSYYEKALDIAQNTLSTDHDYLTTIYSHMALAYQSMGDYSMAGSYCEKVHNIQEKQLPSNHPNVAANYHNLGLVYYSIGNYTMALSYFKKAFEINQKVLPPDHLDLALSTNSISFVYLAMGNLSAALSYAEKALQIQKSGPPNHPNLAMIYSNIAAIHLNASNYPVALSFYEKAIDIYQETHLSDSPDLARTYSNVGALHKMTNNHTEALLYHEKALNILKKTLPENHPDWIIYYVNIGCVHQSIGDYPTALSYMEKAFEVGQKYLASDHPKLTCYYYAIATVYESMGNYSKALSYYKQARDINQKTLPSDHPDLVTVNNRIAWVCVLTDESSSVSADVTETYDRFSFGPAEISELVRSLKNLQQFRSSNTTTKTNTVNDINTQVQGLRDLEASVVSTEKMIETFLNSPASNHPSSFGIFNNINDRNTAAQHLLDAFSTTAQALKMMSETASTNNNTEQDASVAQLQSESLAHVEKYFEAIQTNLPSNNPFMAGAYNNMGVNFLQGNDYANALSYFEKALEVLDKSFSNNPSLLSMTYSNMAKALAGLGRYNQAVNYARQALTTANTNFESTDAELKNYQDLFDQLQQKL